MISTEAPSSRTPHQTMTDSRTTQNTMFVVAILFFVHLVWRFAIYQGKLMR